jgi:hypothetical protein
MSFDKLQIAGWIERQVELENIGDPAEAAKVEALCLDLARTGALDCYRFPKRAQLFWRGLTRGNRNSTAPVG